MPPVLGNYIPSAGFSFPRSFVYDIDIALYGDTLSGTGNIRFIHATPPDTTFITVEFWNDWYLWSSNMYQISEIVKNFYYETPPSIVQHPLPFDFGWWVNPTTKRAGLFLNWFSGPRTPAIIGLPRQSSNYWLPRPLI